jgi:hypothetical protein
VELVPALKAFFDDREALSQSASVDYNKGGIEKAR